MDDLKFGDVWHDSWDGETVMVVSNSDDDCMDVLVLVPSCRPQLTGSEYDFGSLSTRHLAGWECVDVE